MIRLLVVVLALLYPVKAAAEPAYTVIYEVNGDSLSSISDVEVDSTGTLWVAAESGLLRMKDGIWTKERQDRYAEIVIAYDGAVWCGGTYGQKKILRFDGAVWTELATPDNYEDFGVGPDNTVWIAGSSVTDPKVYRYNGTTWTSYTTADGLAYNWVGRLVVSPTGEVWARHQDPKFYEPVENHHLGISHFKDGVWNVFNVTNGFISNVIEDFAFLPDSSTVVCYGYSMDSNGITRWNGSVWSEIASGYFGYLSVDRNGILWILENTHIIGLNSGTMELVYDYSYSGLISRCITPAAVTSNGRIFVGSQNGLLMIDDTLHLSDDKNESPQSYPTIAAYPNPFNPATTISYAIPASGRVMLTVYSVTGQKVATLVDEMKEAGSHSVVFDGKGLSSGVYFYRLETAGTVKTGRMMMVK